MINPIIVQYYQIQVHFQNQRKDYFLIQYLVNNHQINYFLLILQINTL
jgi:hypothetical protein